MALAAIAATLSSAFVLIFVVCVFTVCEGTITESQGAVNDFLKNFEHFFASERWGVTLPKSPRLNSLQVIRKRANLIEAWDMPGPIGLPVLTIKARQHANP